jgi:hypothetical protein
MFPADNFLAGHTYTFSLTGNRREPWLMAHIHLAVGARSQQLDEVLTEARRSIWVVPRFLRYKEVGRNSSSEGEPDGQRLVLMFGSIAGPVACLDRRKRMCTRLVEI